MVQAAVADYAQEIAACLHDGDALTRRRCIECLGKLGGQLRTWTCTPYSQKLIRWSLRNDSYCLLVVEEIMQSHLWKRWSTSWKAHGNAEFTHHFKLTCKFWCRYRQLELGTCCRSTHKTWCPCHQQLAQAFHIFMEMYGSICIMHRYPMVFCSCHVATSLDIYGCQGAARESHADILAANLTHGSRSAMTLRVLWGNRHSKGSARLNLKQFRKRLRGWLLNIKSSSNP